MSTNRIKEKVDAFFLRLLHSTKLNKKLEIFATYLVSDGGLRHITRSVNLLMTISLLFSHLSTYIVYVEYTGSKATFFSMWAAQDAAFFSLWFTIRVTFWFVRKHIALVKDYMALLDRYKTSMEEYAQSMREYHAAMKKLSPQDN